MLQSLILASETTTSETHNPLLPEVSDLIWSSVVFVVILAFFLWKILPNVKAMLDKRAEAIEGNIEKAVNGERLGTRISSSVVSPVS